MDFVSATELQLQMDVDPFAATGLYDIVVVNTDGGKGDCKCFTVS